MRIQHNIMAMSAYRNYTNNVSAMKKNLEKLSSGYKINRAGDDAAGLAISEKMRAQITGLETAQKNAKDGISLVQTAEGALQEVHDMLNRMVELATQSANGTYEGDTDRAQLQKEISQLKSEINRIADSANFNGIKLLNGDMDGGMKLGTMTDATVSAVADGVQSGGESKAGKYEIDLSDLKITGGTANGSLAKVTAFKIGNVAVKNAAGTTALTFTALDLTKAGTITGADIADKLNGGTVKLDGITYTIEASEGKLTLTSDEVPTDQDDLDAADYTVAITAQGKEDNQGWDQSVHIIEQAQVSGGNKLAQGEIDISSAVTDGGAITIGKETYVFKVGADSTVTEGSGYKVIDLSSYKPTDANLAKAAAAKISAQSNAEFHVTSKGDGTIHLTEKAGAIDYSKTKYELTDPDGGATTGNVVGSETKNATWKNVVKTGAMAAGKGKALTLQIGDTHEDFNQLKVNIGDCHADAIGVGAIDISTQEGAQSAVADIKAAINYISDVRGTLGATQNRLDHTINNLSVMTENIQDAESTIRDVDVAEEMMAYTKNNILIQSAQAMLAQANQVPQGVLQLLQ